jgi:hypothetical protein
MGGRVVHTLEQGTDLALQHRQFMEVLPDRRRRATKIVSDCVHFDCTALKLGPFALHLGPKSVSPLAGPCRGTCALFQSPTDRGNLDRATIEVGRERLDRSRVAKGGEHEDCGQPVAAAIAC